MKTQIKSVCSLLLAATAICRVAAASPNDLAQPGETSSSAVSMSDLAIRPIVSGPEVKFDAVQAQHDRRVNRIWLASLLAVAASTSMDAATSWGKHEGNGFLASSNGTFGARGISIKAAMLAAVVVPQIAFRHHQGLKTKFAIGNLIEAGIFTGVSIHNLGVTAPR